MNQVEQTTPRIIGVLEKGMWELKRDRAFEELFVPLEKDALTRLKANIEREGCTESVYTWNKVIVDGHNRYRICQETNTPFPVTEMEFADKDEAILWMIDRQLGRRNLSPYERTTLALKREEMYARKAKARQRAGKKFDGVPHNCAEGEGKGETREHIAKEAGVSHNTVARVKRLIAKADDDTKRKLRRGEMSINRAITELDKKEHEGQTKICDRCGKEKPITDFPRSRGGLFFLSTCKACKGLERDNSQAEVIIPLPVIEEAPTSDNQPEQIESSVAVTESQPDTPAPLPSTAVDRPTDGNTPLDPTYDRMTNYQGLAHLDHPIEMPTANGEPPRVPRPFMFVQGQIHFALKNMLKELRIGLNWISEEDKNRVPELLQMLNEACSQGEHMIKEEMEVENHDESH